jgi:DNA-binding PadR family transcriptional regulator
MGADHDMYAGLIRLHVLHHAAEGDLFGFGMIQELRRHGYDLSPGTLYPILHRMETRGLLASRKAIVNDRVRRVYRATPKGRRTLEEAKLKVRELFSELFDNSHG